MTDAITPLARTFPAWVSILTGRYPQTTGALVNLLPRESLHTGPTLPEILREHGYHTVYAIDETRFSNVDQSYGFDQALTAPIGASDFVIPLLADIPLANLAVNSRAGKLLFPHLYANRGAAMTYDPNRFIDRIRDGLHTERPLFMAVHLTLPHWPYTWADTRHLPEDGNDANLAPYRSAIRRVDQQFGDLLQLLQRRGVLDHAIVVVLSDHGQALRQPGDLLTAGVPAWIQARLGIDSMGHGTSVLSPAQFRVVLGFKAFGAAAELLPPSGQIDVPASLIDIAPTLVDLLQISPPTFDGLSLAPVLRAGPEAIPDLRQRLRFTETEFNLKGAAPEEMNTAQLLEAAKVYRADPITDRVTLRPEWLDSILADRQYAVLQGQQLLVAALPNLRADGQRQLVAIADPFSGGGEVPAGDAQIASDVRRLQQTLVQRFHLTATDSTVPDSPSQAVTNP
jgi:arylsulfatase A-like enzyme